MARRVKSLFMCFLLNLNCASEIGSQNSKKEDEY